MIDINKDTAISIGIIARKNIRDITEIVRNHDGDLLHRVVNEIVTGMLIGVNFEVQYPEIVNSDQFRMLKHVDVALKNTSNTTLCNVIDQWKDDIQSEEETRYHNGDYPFE